MAGYEFAEYNESDLPRPPGVMEVIFLEIERELTRQTRPNSDLEE